MGSVINRRNKDWQQKNSHPGELNAAKLALRKNIKSAAIAGCVFSTAVMAQDPMPLYEEKGQPGDRQSWQTPEFKANWGLGTNNFDAAYARGATGQGVKIGVLDSGTYFQHFEFSKPNTLAKFTEPFMDGDVPDFDSRENRLDDHGTHVAGIIIANRNGVGMHGGAFNSTLYVGRAFHSELEAAEAAKTIADSGVIALSNSWGYDFSWEAYRQVIDVDINGTIQKAGHGPSIADVKSNNGDSKLALENPDSEFSQLSELAQRGTVVVFAAGNDRYYSASYGYNQNNFRPRLFRGIHSTPGFNMLPTLLVDDKTTFESVEKNFLNVVMLNRDSSISHYSDLCGSSKYYCVGAAGGSSEGPLNSYLVATPEVPAGVAIETYKPGPYYQYIHSNVENGQILSDYYRTFSTGVTTNAPPSADETTQRQAITSNYVMMFGTSMAAPTATAGLAVIKSRFPYLSNSQVRDTLLSTARDVGAPGIDRVYGWGSMDLDKAMGGPAKFWQLKASYDATLTEIEQRAAAQYNPIVAKADYFAELAYKYLHLAKFLRDNGDPNSADDLERLAQGFADEAYGLEVTRIQPNEPGDTQEAAFDYYDFAVNLPGQRIKDLCDRDECIADTWSNDIDGPGGLSKFGAGTLTMTGHNTYQGPTTIYEGALKVNGSLTSNVVVQDTGILGGSGAIGTLTVNTGGTVAPGNSIGTLSTADVTFNPGSRYAVEVATSGRSDQIDSSGVANLDGGDVLVSLENSPNLLSLPEAASLLGQQYNILSAAQGIHGQFASVTPNYLFLGTSLSYQPNQLTLAINRNQTTFASVALSRNERAVAEAADTLGAGNRVYESLLTSDSAEQARQAFNQLDGQAHSDIAAAQIADSRYLRDAVNGRLQQAQALNPDADIQVASNGGWVQLLGGHGQVDADHNATSYSTSTTGVLLGLDTDVGNGWRVGAATGYTKTDLNGSSRTSADSDNYHLSIYGGKRFESIALRLGGATTWHRFDTSRDVVYGNQSTHEKANYNARTDQLFGEIGYTAWTAFEPFANLSYINFQNDSFKERGGAAALHASKQSQDATVSTLGLRGHTQLPISATRSVTLRGELGWEHQYGELDRETSLKFAGSEAAFAVHSVPVSRDGAVVKAAVEMAMTRDTLVSLNYTGLVSSQGGGSSVNAGFTFRF